MRRLEHQLGLGRQPRDAVERAPAGDLLHQGLGVEAFPPGDRLERFVHEREHPLALPLLHAVLKGEGEDRLDARRAARDHRDRAGRRDRRDRRVPHRAHVLEDGLAPVGEGPALFGEPGGLVVGLLLEERHQLCREVDRLIAVVGDAQREQQIRPPHDAEPDAPVRLDGPVDGRQRVRVHLDHVVEEANGEPNDSLHLFPIDRPRTIGRLPRELRHVEGTEVTGLVPQEGLFAAGVCRLDQAHLRRGVGGARVDPVDEDHARIAGAPGRAHDTIKDLLRGEAPHLQPGVGIDKVVFLALGERVHEDVGGSDRDVEVRDPAVELALDELEDVWMIHFQDPHVCTATGTSLFHGLRRGVEHTQEGHGSRGAATRRRDDVVLRTKPREREPGAAPAIVRHEAIGEVRVLAWNGQVVYTADACIADLGGTHKEELLSRQRLEEWGNGHRLLHPDQQALSAELPRGRLSVNQAVEILPNVAP